MGFCYRCFLPDLTDFTKPRCVRPNKTANILTRTEPLPPQIEKHFFCAQTMLATQWTTAICPCGKQWRRTSAGKLQCLFLAGKRFLGPTNHCYLPLWRAVAEREGFEPSVGVNLHTLSKRAPSTARPPLLLNVGS